MTIGLAQGEFDGRMIPSSSIFLIILTRSSNLSRDKNRDASLCGGASPVSILKVTSVISPGVLSFEKTSSYSFKSSMSRVSSLPSRAHLLRSRPSILHRTPGLNSLGLRSSLWREIMELKLLLRCFFRLFRILLSRASLSFRNELARIRNELVVLVSLLSDSRSPILGVDMEMRSETDSGSCGRWGSDSWSPSSKMPTRPRSAKGASDLDLGKPSFSKGLGEVALWLNVLK